MHSDAFKRRIFVMYVYKAFLKLNVYLDKNFEVKIFTVWDELQNISP